MQKMWVLAFSLQVGFINGKKNGHANNKDRATMIGPGDMLSLHQINTP
jgi:hypothetical protein